MSQSTGNDKKKKRLIFILDKVETCESPSGWKKIVTLSIKGVNDIGFSRESHCLLIISNQGRSVIDCNTGEQLARDYAPFGDWFDEQQLLCNGIGPLKSERISTSGVNGGGLPHGNRYGDSVEVVAPHWPDYDLYFCRNYKSVLIESHQAECARIDSGNIRAYGFSYCGNYIVSANDNIITLWQRTLSNIE